VRVVGLRIPPPADHLEPEVLPRARQRGFELVERELDTGQAAWTWDCGVAPAPHFLTRREALFWMYDRLQAKTTYPAGRAERAADTGRGAAMATIVDAWVVGEHELPRNAPRRVVGSAVVVHDRDTDEWTGMSLDQFEAEFEWVPEKPEPLIAVGDLGVV
jgi:hypothetical protein